MKTGLRSCETWLKNTEGTNQQVYLARLLYARETFTVRLRCTFLTRRIHDTEIGRMTYLDWGVIAVYAVGMLAVGWYYARRTVTTDDYLLGGRNMSPWKVGLSLFATLLSTLTYLAIPGEMIKYGPMVLAQLIAVPFISLVVGWLLIPRIMRLRVTSAYEILETQLGLSVRMLGSCFFLTLRLFWMSLVIFATADAVLVPVLELDASAVPWICAVLGVVTVIYTSMGGLRAVVLTDVIQTGILFGGAVLTVSLITVQMGGVGEWWPSEWPSHWQPPVFWYDPEVRFTFVGAALSMFTWFVCTAGSDQMAIQRYLATRDAPAARRMFNTSLLASVLLWPFLAAVGLALLAYFQARPEMHEMLPPGQTVLENADKLLPLFIVRGLPTGITGIVIAGLLAAAMSSLSSGLNSACSVITTDFVDRFSRKRENSDNSHVRLAKYISFLIGVVVVFLGTLIGEVEGNLLELCYKIANLLAAPLFLLFFMAIFIPWSTPFGTYIGAICAVLTAIDVAYCEAWGLTFVWMMPASFIVGALVGMQASLLPIGRKRSMNAEPHT
jgi:solute:Na+ symporter, SSS family